jgi:uncharacterized protein
MVGRQFFIDELARLSEFDRVVAAVVFGQFLLDDVCLNCDAEMVRLSGEVGGDMVIIVRLEGVVPQVAPENGDHAEFVRIFKSFGNFHDLPAGFFGAEIDRRAHGCRAHVVCLVNAREQNLIRFVRVRQQFVMIDLQDKWNAVGVFPRDGTKNSERTRDRIASAVEGKLYNVFRIEINRIRRKGSRGRMLDALIHGQDGHVAGVCKMAGFVEALHVDKHTRVPVAVFPDPVDKIWSGEMKQIFWDGGIVESEQVFGLIAEQFLNVSVHVIDPMMKKKLTISLKKVRYLVNLSKHRSRNDRFITISSGSDERKESMKHNRIVITGATGLIGSRLYRALRNRGCEIILLHRNPDKARKEFPDAEHVYLWAPGLQGAWKNAFEGADVVIHLAGESIGGARWTEAYKKRIYQSRINGTREIVAAIGAVKNRPATLISASAVGCYGNCDDAEIDETSPPGTDFLAQLCADWEMAASEAVAFGVRVVTPRFGIILAEEGGALPRLVQPFRMFAGGRLGSGRQWMSWIHIDDVIALFLHVLESEAIKDAINFTSPAPVRNRDFAGVLGTVLHRPSSFIIPGLLLRMVVGKFAVTLLEGQRVYPRKAITTGYRFIHAELSEALRSLLSKQVL